MIRTPNPRGYPRASAYLVSENTLKTHQPDWSYDLREAALTSYGTTLKLFPIRLAFKKVSKKTLAKREADRLKELRSKAARKAWATIRSRRLGATKK
jgi:hypothetical protein